jgi:small subunit ribosomal protein S13
VNFPEQRLVKVRSQTCPFRNLRFIVQRSLETFYGIGPSVSERLMARFYIHPTAKIGGLANKQVQDLTAALSNMTIENDLRRRMGQYQETAGYGII